MQADELRAAICHGRVAAVKKFLRDRSPEHVTGLRGLLPLAARAGQDGLCEMLKQLVGVDPLDAVSALYRAELEEQAEESLRVALPSLELPLLLPVLRGFVVTRCVAEDIGAGSALADSLAWCTDDESGDFLSELSWFDNFPRNVPMGSAVAALKFLEKMKQ